MTPQKRQKISVIIPTYNCQQYLGEAIRSVLSQIYKADEILVVDDGSKDQTRQKVQKYESNVRYCLQKHQGIGAARNRGVELAKGDFLAFLDADDIWHKQKLSLQLEAFKKNSKLDMAFGHFEEFLEGEGARGKFRVAQKARPGFMASAMLVKRESFLQIGYFETRFEVGEFIDWLARAQEKNFHYVMLPDTVYRRRIHGTNTVISRPKLGYLEVVSSALKRNRQRNV